MVYFHQNQDYPVQSDTGCQRYVLSSGQSGFDQKSNLINQALSGYQEELDNRII